MRRSLIAQILEKCSKLWFWTIGIHHIILFAVVYPQSFTKFLTQDAKIQDFQTLRNGLNHASAKSDDKIPLKYKLPSKQSAWAKKAGTRETEV